MNPDDLQQAWQSQSAKTQVTIDTEVLRKVVQRGGAHSAWLRARPLHCRSPGYLISAQECAMGVEASRCTARRGGGSGRRVNGGWPW